MLSMRIEKEESLTRFSKHLKAAKLEREFYRKGTATASKQLEEYGKRINSCGAACFRNLQASHYTFDFAQSVCIPYHARQPCPVYFKCERKIHIFGVCNPQGLPKQVNYLIDESQTIGQNAKQAHGPNSVISMLHHYFAKHALKEKVVLCMLIIVLAKTPFSHWLLSLAMHDRTL